MIPSNQRNRKSRVNLSCPTCGKNLNEAIVQGFTLNNETFCCEGCAEGTGCTCVEPVFVAPKAGNRRGNLGHRNPENSPRDKNFNEEVDTSGRILGRRRETKKAPPRIPRRGDLQADGRKMPRSQNETRDSMTEPSRGRSEFRGSMNKRLNYSGGMDRVSKTASKGASASRRTTGADPRRATSTRRSTKRVFA